MKTPANNKIYLALIFVVATAIMVYFMPRDNKHKYTYEENRPWTYNLLTAPFDITIYRDSATVKQMIDSVEATMVPIYRRDASMGARVIAAIQSNDSVPAALKARLASAVDRVYRRGIVGHSSPHRTRRPARIEIQRKQQKPVTPHIRLPLPTRRLCHGRLPCRKR